MRYPFLFNKEIKEIYIELNVIKSQVSTKSLCVGIKKEIIFFSWQYPYNNI